MSMDNKPDNLESVMRRIQKLLAIASQLPTLKGGAWKTKNLDSLVDQTK